MKPDELPREDDDQSPMKDRSAWAVIGLLNVPWLLLAVWCVWQVVK